MCPGHTDTCREAFLACKQNARSMARIPDLSQELDRICHGARVKRVALVAREHADNPGLPAWLDDLARKHPDLALVGARHGGRPERLLRALLDPRVSVTRCALGLLRSLPELPDLGPFLTRVCPAVRAGLLSILSTRATPDQAAALLPLVEERHGPGEAVHLLRALSPAELDSHLPRLAPRLSSWAGLAARHPGPVLAFLRQRLETTPDRDRARVWQAHRKTWRVLAEHHPGELLQLAFELHPPESLPPLPLGLLARSHPEQVEALLTRAELAPPPDLARKIRRLGSERVHRLARHFAHDACLVARLLAACPPSWRRETFEAAYQGADLSAREWPLELLESLPHELRTRESERMLGLRSVSTTPSLRLEVAARAAVAVAEPILEPETRAALAEDRAAAISRLLWCYCLNRADLAPLLRRLVPRLKNEQDPVRQAACGALKASCLEPESLQPLEELVDAVVQARDTSWPTRTSLQELGMQLLRRGALDPEGPYLPFSLNLQRKLVGQSGQLAWPYLRDLPRGSEAALYAAFERWVKASNERDRYWPVVSLAGALGKRARNLPGLQKLILQATRAKPDWLAGQAIHQYLEDPAHRDQRVRQLLDQDESVIALAPVFWHVHRRRQDWLDPYLQGRVIKGRFVNQNTVYLLPAAGGFHRWLPRQQTAFGRLLVRVIEDAKRYDRERTSTLLTFCRLTTTELKHLRSYLESPQIPIQEAALQGSSYLDEPGQALSELLQNLDGDRARVAMYAIPRVARFTPPEELAARLGELLGRERLKVTVHKEALRLLGAHRVSGASQILLSQWQRPGLHRDVRIAVLHAARAILDETCWEILSQATRGQPEVARALLDQSPELLPESARKRYAELVIEVAGSPEARVRETAYNALPQWAAGLEEPVARALSGAVLDLEVGPEWRLAAEGLVRVAGDGFGLEVLAETARALESQPGAPDAEPERDRPAWQRLNRLVGMLCGLAWRKRKALRLEDLVGGELGVRLGVAALDWPTLQSLQDPAESDGIALAAFEAELADPGFVWEGLERAYERLSLGPPAWRRMAVRLVAAAGRRSGWEQEWRERLLALRRDGDARVRWEAGQVFTREE